MYSCIKHRLVVLKSWVDKCFHLSTLKYPLMNNKSIIVLSILLFANTAKGQFVFKKSTKSAYILYARHFTTKYLVDSGSNNLVGRKMNIAWEAGFNFDFQIEKKLYLRSGIAGHIQLIGDIWYGTPNIPPSVPYSNPEFEKKYFGGGEFRERINIGLPIKLSYMFISTKRLEFLAASGPYLNIYFPTRNEEIGNTLIDNNNSYEKYIIQRKFNRNNIFTGPDFSKPFLEWQFDIELVRKFKRNGAIVAGLKTHIGTRKLETAEFITWPEFSDYRSKGHYSINRSYIGVYTGYRFRKN